MGGKTGKDDSPSQLILAGYDVFGAIPRYGQTKFFLLQLPYQEL